MPVPTHFKFSVRGVFLNTDETWSYGFHVNRKLIGGADATLSDVHESQISDVLESYHASSAFSAGCKLTEWRCYQIGTDGNMESPDSVKVHVYDTAINGTGAANKYPPQIALVITFVANSKGPGHFGRCYLPGPAASISTDWRLSDANADLAGQGFATMIDALTHEVDLPGTPAQARLVNVSSSGGSAGTIQDVHHLEVGRALDTMRSRRKGVLEERHVGAAFSWDLI